MDDQTERDSMGSLAARSQTSSLRTTSAPGLNAKLLGTEFERNSDSEIVNRALIRLVAVFGDPWGRDQATAKIMAQEWETALADLPAIVVDDAVTEWMRGNSKWPRPADVRTIADRMLRGPIEAAARRHGVHPRRIEPAESMRGFVYVESPLRQHAKWRQWLDTIHPMIEHECFRNAQCIEPHEIFGLSPFEADYVNKNCGRSLTEFFGRPIGLGIGPHPCRDIIWSDQPWVPPTPEERERGLKVLAAFLEPRRTGRAEKNVEQTSEAAE